MGRHFLRLFGGPENFSFLIPHSSRLPEIPFFATQAVSGISKQYSARRVSSGLPFLVQHKLFWLQKPIVDVWIVLFWFFEGSENFSFFIPHSSRPPELSFFCYGSRISVPRACSAAPFSITKQNSARRVGSGPSLLPQDSRISDPGYIPLLVPRALPLSDPAHPGLLDIPLWERTFILFSFVIAHIEWEIWTREK